jgi:hypothetical protein
VWWYPWWWDWYWYRCHWHSHFHWDFFYAGYYVVWYDAGVWWFRPRFGRWVQYRLPYTYQEIRYRAVDHGVYLPAKPPREIYVPFKETTIKNLIKEKDPQMFRTIEKEYKNGNLQKKQTQYQTKTQNEILRKNKEYGIKDTKRSYMETIKRSKTINQTKKTYTPVSRDILRSQNPKDSKQTMKTQPRYNESNERSTKVQQSSKTPAQRSTQTTKQTPRYEEKKTTKNVTNTKATQKKNTSKQTPRYEEKKAVKKTTPSQARSTGLYQQDKKSPVKDSKEKSSKTNTKKTPTKARDNEPDKQSYKKVR